MFNKIGYELTRRITGPYWLGILFLFLAAGFCALRAFRRGKLTKRQALALPFLAGYLGIVFASTVFCRKLLPAMRWHLIPFWSYARAIARGTGTLLRENALNVLLFLPLGFLLPQVDLRCRSAKRTALLCLGLSYSIELLQLLLRRGTFELFDDPLHNLLGGMLGLLLWRLTARQAAAKTSAQRQDGETSCAAPADGPEHEGEQTSAMSPELEVFFAMLRAGILGEEPKLDASREQSASLDLALIRKLAILHEVVLPVYTALAAVEEPALQRLKTELRSAYAPAFAKSINQSGEGEALIDALDRAGIDCIPLKGWKLRELYADPCTRGMTDLDILIRRYNFEQLRAVLEAQGFHAEKHSSWKHDSFEKKPYMNVELHKRLTDDSAGIRRWESRIWSACTPEPGKKHVFQMSREDFYIFHILHMEKDFKNGALSFRRLADTWLLWKKWPDMDRTVIGKQLRGMGAADFAGRMEKLALRCFENGPGDPNTEILLRYAAETGITEDQKTRYKLGRMAALSEGSVRGAKLSSLRKALFLPMDRMKAQFPVLERYPALLPYFWLKRILYFLKRPKNRLKQLDYRGISQEQLEDMRKVFAAGGLHTGPDREKEEA